MCQFVCIIRGCLYERRDGTFADSPVYGKTNWTGRDGRDPGLYKFLLYLSPDVYMHGNGKFFVPSRASGILVCATGIPVCASGIPVCATGIPPQPGRFLPCKHLLPGRDGRRDDFGVLK